MQRYKVTTTIVSELSIEEVENLLMEFINSKIGVMTAGKGETLSSDVFNAGKNKLS